MRPEACKQAEEEIQVGMVPTHVQLPLDSRRHAFLARSLVPQARGGSFSFFPGVVGPDELVAPTDAP